MFELVKKAGLSMSEMATILGVSRVAVYNWKAKRTKPHALLVERVGRLITFLEEQIKSNKLPLKDAGKDARAERIVRLKSAFGAQ